MPLRRPRTDASPDQWANSLRTRLRPVARDHEGHSLRMLLRRPPPEHATEEEEQPVIPEEGPGEANASR